MSESFPELKTSPRKAPRRFWGLTPLEWIVVVAILILLVALLVPNVQQATSGGRRERCRNNLKYIALALHYYHDEHESFPPVYIADVQGRPMHSWRVLILPYLDRSDLYREYRFDEPWDGPNNRKLADRIGDVYRCPTEDAERDSQKVPGNKNQTSYVAVVGPETAWPGAAATSISDFEDGPENTLLVVETANSGIHWMEPRDLHVGQMAPTINSKSGQGISSRHIGGAHGALANGAVRFFSENLPAETVRGLLTIHGGERLPDDL